MWETFCHESQDKNQTYSSSDLSEFVLRQGSVSCRNASCFYYVLVYDLAGLLWSGSRNYSGDSGKTKPIVRDGGESTNIWC